MRNLTKILKRSRYVFNLDDKEKEAVKRIFSVDGNEVIQVVLDDSFFKNLERGIVLTNKKIYWNIKGARAELRTGETTVNIAGPGQVNAADLKAASVFVQNSSSGLVIHILDESRHIRIPLKWFEVDEPLKILFYYYFSKFVADYNPAHNANKGKYTAFLKTRRGRSISLIPLIYDTINHIVTGLLLAALFLPRLFRGFQFAAAEKVLFVSVLVKLVGILFRYRKSALMNALLIAAASCFLIMPDIFPRIETLYLYSGYAVLSVLFSVFDFDRIFKYLIFALAIVSALILFLQFFWLGPLF
jgi:hypothetical protein